MMSTAKLQTVRMTAILVAFAWCDTRIVAAADEPMDLAQTSSREPGTVRVAAVQARPRLIDWRIKDPSEALAAVDRNLAELEEIVGRAGELECDVVAFPEDTLGLLNWYGMNQLAAEQVIPAAVSRMIDRLGRATASRQMYLVVCSDFIESDGATYNTAFFLNRQGKEIGRYHKTCPTWSERGARKQGASLPVFPTADLGTVGMLICYDLVFPETSRCLALAGADVVFFPTMGGAAVGDGDIGLQALRVRAAENQVYLVVAFRGTGSMIISPRGEILARAEGPDGLAIADINPLDGRQGGDAMNHQRDMRARLFRERNVAAFGILADPHPPILAKVPIDITEQEAGRIAAEVLTVGEEEYRQAEVLAREQHRRCHRRVHPTADQVPRELDRSGGGRAAANAAGVSARITLIYCRSTGRLGPKTSRPGAGQTECSRRFTSSGIRR